MKLKLKKDMRGFNIIELLIVIMVFTIFLGAIFSGHKSGEPPAPWRYDKEAPVYLQREAVRHNKIAEQITEQNHLIQEMLKQK